MVRIITLFLDFCILGFLIFLTISEPGEELVDWLIIIAIYFVVLLNIFCVYKKSNNGKSWLSLYFQRKALEEKKRIEQIKKDI